MSDEIAGWERFMAWREACASAAEATGAPMSHGMPDAWYEAGMLGCLNGHRTLSRARRMLPGKGCLSCGDALMLVPPSIPYLPASAVDTAPSDLLARFNEQRRLMLEAWRDLAQHQRAPAAAVEETACAMRQLMQVLAPEDTE